MRIRFVGSVIIAVMLGLIFLFGESPITYGQTPDIQPLTLGKPIERELKSDEAHSYSLSLQAGQFLNVVVEQKGIDVVVTLFDANNKKTVEVDSPNGTQGPEPVSIIIETAGTYRLEVRSLEKTAPAGKYEVQILEQRAATDKDKDRVAAMTGLAESNGLRSKGTAESLTVATQKLGAAVALFKKIEDAPHQGETLFTLGAVYSDLGESQKALENYHLSLDMFRKLGDKRSEATTLNDIGTVYLQLGEAKTALDYYNPALVIHRITKNRDGEAITLSNIGVAYEYLSEIEQAMDADVKALGIRRQIIDKSGEGFTLANIGKLYSIMGEQQKALENYGQALKIFEELGDRRTESGVLIHLGSSYQKLGELQKSLDYYNRAISIAHEIGDSVDEANALGGIGLIFIDLEEYKKAIDVNEKILSIFRTLGDTRFQSQALNNIGLAYSGLKDYGKALEYYAQVLSLNKGAGHKSQEAITLDNIGRVHSSMGESRAAIQYYYQSLPLGRESQDNRGEAFSLEYLEYDWNLLQNKRYSVFFGKKAVTQYQSLRANITGLDKSVQKTFLKSIESVYRRLASSLVAQGRSAEALQILNLFKDQQYFDFKSLKQTAPISFTARETRLSAELDTRIEAVVTASRAIDEFRRSVGKREPTANESIQIRSFELKLARANAEYQAFLTRAEKEFAAPSDDMDTVPELADLKAMQAALRETSDSTKQNTVAVYTLVGDDGFRTLLVTADGITSAAYAINGKDLNAKALQFWKLLRTPKYDPREAANELYRIVFEPLLDKLPRDTKTILWSLDGNLRYVPMATLFDGRQYLVERYQNVVFTRADNEQMTRDVSNGRSGTGMGSSEAHEVSLGNDTFNASALPSVKMELGRIFKQGNRGVLNGEVLIDKRFTKAAMLDALKARKPLVHIASHFRFVAGDEANSFLLLGDGMPFTLDEMKQQKDLFAGVELLALSACQTAAQRPDANGREVDGFAELAQRLGAGAVMASLWEVSDNSTAELMTRFYQDYTKTGVNKAEAIRKAQLALLKGEYRTSATANRQLTQDDAETEKNIKIDPSKLVLYKRNPNAPFAHPFYWSPFILIGNWK